MKTLSAGCARKYRLLAMSLTLLGAGGRAYGQRVAPRSAGCAGASASIEIAVRERERGHSDAAVVVLEDLHTRCPTPQVTAQLALAESDTRRYGSAWAHLQAALAEPDDPWVRSRRAALLVARTELRRHMATIEVRAATADAELYVDGVRLGPAAAPEPWVIGPGARRVEVRAPGLASEQRTVIAAEGEAVVIDLPAPAPAPAVAVASAAPPTPAGAPTTRLMAPPARRPTARYVGYGLIGVGAASAVVGVVFAVLTRVQADALLSATSASPGNEGAFVRFVASPTYPSTDRSSATACLLAMGDASPDGRAANDLCSTQAQTRTLAWAFGIAGAAALGTGLALALLRPGEPARPVSLGVTPMLGSTTGVLVHGAF